LAKLSVKYVVVVMGVWEQPVIVLT